MAIDHWHAGPLGADQFCMACDAEDEAAARRCTYCPSPAVTESAVGLEGDYSEPNALGQRQYIAPRPEPRCGECQASFERAARREQRLADEGWV